MKRWAVCLDSDISILFQKVVCYDDSINILEVKYQQIRYSVPQKNLRQIEEPEYKYGDLVSPKNHADIVGTIIEIIYHFKNNEPFYLLDINGKVKSKRYFKADLIRR